MTNEKKSWVIVIEGEAMTKEEALEEARMMSEKKGWKMYIAEIQEEVNKVRMDTREVK